MTHVGLNGTIADWPTRRPGGLGGQRIYAVAQNEVMIAHGVTVLDALAAQILDGPDHPDRAAHRGDSPLPTRSTPTRRSARWVMKTLASRLFIGPSSVIRRCTPAVADLTSTPSILKKVGVPMAVITLAAAAAILACTDIAGISPLAARRDVFPLAVIVSPHHLSGWAFVDDQHDAACTDASFCGFASGPGTAPAGSGSAELATSGVGDGYALMLQGFQGTRLDALTGLRYSTYRQSADPGNNLSIALQLNVDYDLTDQASGYQGRLVYEPYQASPGQVTQGSWQRWDARAGRWWGTKATVSKNGVAASNPCVQSHPCSWSELLAAFPNAGIHATLGAVVLKAGSGWPAFRGNVDQLTIAVGQSSTTYDFELADPAAVTLIPPNVYPHALFDSLGTVNSTEFPEDGPFIRDIIVLDFNPYTPLAARQAAIDSIGGQVVGGRPFPDGDDGTYYVRITGGTHEALLNALQILYRQPQISMAMRWSLGSPNIHSYLRPTDGPGWRQWLLDVGTPDASRPNWALEYIHAPMAWGCSVGTGATTSAVVDFGIPLSGNVSGNVDVGASALITSWNAGDSTAWSEGSSLGDHGERVASVMAAVGNDGSGMTGMAWRTRLILRDAGAVGDSVSQNRKVFESIVGAGRAGASVINLSLGIHWGARGYDVSNPDHVARVAEAMLQVTDAIKLLAKSSLHPLIVIAAGNDGQPFQIAGYPAARDAYPRQVLVVGGLDVDGGVWSHSNTGADVYAPAVKVAQATGNDLIVNVEPGTSFAAPLVSGVAVLLKDFDPSLTSDSLISKIKGGARSESGVLKVDAYGALQRAARDEGAPLCGNRLWTDGSGNVVVERDSLRTESIITRDAADYLAFVEPYHGGKRIDLGFSYEYDWVAASRGYHEVSFKKDTTLVPGGAWTSYTWTTDHDKQMWAKRSDSTNGNGQTASVKLLKQTTHALIKDLGSQPIPGTTSGPPGTTCIIEYPVDTSGVARMYMRAGEFSGIRQCMGIGPTGSWDSAPENIPPLGMRNETPILATPAPQGNAVYVPVNIRHYDIAWRSGAICNAIDTSAELRNSDYTVVRSCSVKTVDIDTAVRAMVYRIDTATTAWTAVRLRQSGALALDGREINALEVSEDGKEMMISTTRRVALSENAGEQACHDETLEWLSLDAATAGKVLRTVSLPQGAACGGWVEAGGTRSPYRGASNASSTIAGRASASAPPAAMVYVPWRQLKQMRSSARLMRR